MNSRPDPEMFARARRIATGVATTCKREDYVDMIRYLVERHDDDTFDNTDAAVPAYWRGYDDAYARACSELNRLLNSPLHDIIASTQDGGAYVYLQGHHDLDWQAVVDRIVALRTEVEPMPYPFDDEHVECVDVGWQPIVRKLIEDLRQSGWRGTIEQVKEKFGGLRFYTSGAMSEYQSGLVSAAERQASVTCEQCGAPGKLRLGGWLRTLCDLHYKAPPE